MITFLLKGGLGNQLFETAAALGLVYRNNTDLYIDISWLKISVPYYTKNWLDVFSFKKNYTTHKNIMSKKITEKNESFNPDIYNLKGNIYLDGYWQSYKYFDDIEDTIKTYFVFPPLDKQNIKIGEEIQNSNSVFVHIRRNDYLNFPDLYSDICTEEYYDKSLDIILDKYPDAEFFFFSDDIKWVKKQFGDNPHTHFIDWNSRENNFRDMQLMSMCKHGIIANSSFSWWAAYLNNNPDKIIVSPDKWNNKKNIIDDIIPQGWIKI